MKGRTGAALEAATKSEERLPRAARASLWPLEHWRRSHVRFTPVHAARETAALRQRSRSVHTRTPLTCIVLEYRERFFQPKTNCARVFRRTKEELQERVRDFFSIWWISLVIRALTWSSGIDQEKSSRSSIRITRTRAHKGARCVLLCL